VETTDAPPDSDDSATAPPTSVQAPPTESIAPNPASAEVTLDTPAAASVAIGPEGGSIEATGSDGRHYTLTIPPGYLVDEIDITMTPITGMASPVLDEFVGGVQLEPNGVVFPGVAWLEITATGAPPGIAGFTYSGSGDNVSLGWAEALGDQVRVPVTHFSGAGAGSPGAAAGSYPPAGRGEQKKSELWRAYIENDFQCLADSHPLAAGMPAWYQAWWDQEVEPKLEAAATNDLVLHDALDAVEAWIRPIEAWGDLTCTDMATFLESVKASTGEPATRRAATLASQGLQWAIDTAFNVCADNDDLGEVKYIADWAGVASVVNVLFSIVGEEVNPPRHSAWGPLMQERVKTCLTFELQFRSHIELTEPMLGDFTADMSSVIRGIVPGAAIGLVGDGQENWESAPLSYTPRLDVDTGSPKCRYLLTNITTSDLYVLLPLVPIPEPIREVPLWAKPNRTRKNPDPVRDEPFLLVVERLNGSEFVDISDGCTDLPLGGPNPDGAFGPYYFNILHEDEFTRYWPGFEIALIPGDEGFSGQAVYEYEDVKEGVHVYENTQIDLIHTARGINRG
jgi:hypothetical protein